VKKNIIALFVLFVIAACDRSPLIVAKPDVKPTVQTATIIWTGTSSSTATATASATSSTTANVTATATLTTMAIDTATTAPTLTATTTQTDISSTRTSNDTETLTSTATADDPLPLFIELAADPVKPGIITANTASNTLARFSFFGAQEKVNVTRISFVDYGNNGFDIVSLRAFDGHSTLFCSGAINNTKSLNCANDAGLFTVDGPTTVTIKANVEQIGSVGYAAAFSGDQLSGQVQVIRSAVDGYIGGMDGLFRAIGASGRQYRLTYVGEKSDLTGFTIGGPQMTLRKTQPTVATVAVPQTLMNGEQTVYKFSVTADSNGDVSLRRFTLAREINGVTTEMYYLFENGTRVSPFTIMTEQNDVLIFDFGNERIIAAGTTKVYEVRAGISGAKAGSYITHHMIGDTQNDSNFIWSDDSAVPHSMTSADWWSGYLVRGLPTVAQTLSQ
jgi:hypothetical protein